MLAAVAALVLPVQAQALKALQEQLQAALVQRACRGRGAAGRRG